eukprot:4190706-Amphidinium_carterae.1
MPRAYRSSIGPHVSSTSRGDSCATTLDPTLSFSPCPQPHNALFNLTYYNHTDVQTQFQTSRNSRYFW